MHHYMHQPVQHERSLSGQEASQIKKNPINIAISWCPEGDLNPHDLIRVCGF